MFQLFTFDENPDHAMGTKTILSIFFSLFLTAQSFGGHEVGGVIITYESVAQVNNNALEYVMNVYMFFDKSGPVSSPPGSVSLSHSSSCHTNGSFNLGLVSSANGNFLPLLGSDYCSSSTSIQSTVGLAHYQDTVTLPGTCGNFKFYIASGFGRFNNMTNINSNFGTNLFSVGLNNLNGPNSSPHLPISDMIQAACLSKPLNLFSFSENDGDSLYFGPGTPQLSPNGNLFYAPGYSLTNQTGSSAGFSINQNSGQLQTQVGNVGSYVITIDYAEYRYVSSISQTVLKGHGQFNLILFGTNGCSSAPFDMVHLPIPGADSLDCGDSTVQVATTRKIAPASLTANASEFMVLSARSGTLPVSSVKIISDTIIELAFSQPLPGSDTIRVVAQNGADSNVVLSQCGKELLANADTLTFYSPSAGSVTAGFGFSANVLYTNFSSGTSTGAITSYIWYFGDGSSPASGQSPNHTYSAPGQYNVTLVVANTCGITDSLTQTIRVCDSLMAGFTFSHSADTVNFDAGGSSGVDNYFWDFGDGSTGNGAQANHKFAPGAYLVTLYASNLCGDTIVITDSVKACEDPLADWTYTVVSTTSAGMKVDFDGSASNNASSFIWDFGDGNTNTTSLTPTHTYLTASLNYYVSLTVFNDCSDDSQSAFRLNQIGLEEVNLAQWIQIYPNPASTALQVEINQDFENLQSLTLLNMAGEEVRSISTEGRENSIKVDVSELPAGIYILQLRGSQYRVYERVVIQ